jgi:hypothetical protein
MMNIRGEGYRSMKEKNIKKQYKNNRFFCKQSCKNLIILAKHELTISAKAQNNFVVKKEFTSKT